MINYNRCLKTEFNATKHQAQTILTHPYYNKEFPAINASASQIPWILDDGIGTMLPVMQSDIMLSHKEKVLIIDAKYYTHTTQVQYDVHSLHSANLYQIFTYVKNKEAELEGKPHEVSGMLLYARTDETVQPDNAYQMSGNTRVRKMIYHFICKQSDRHSVTLFAALVVMLMLVANRTC